MIRTIPNPKMNREDVVSFRTVMHKCMTGDFSVSERQAIDRQKQRMKSAEQIIRKNNGGKNPILGF